MANLKDIKDRLNSISSTKKITKAMKMVAASKVKKSESAVKASRPFTSELYNMFMRLLKSVGNEYSVAGLKVEKGIDNYPALMQKRDIKTVGVLVITSNKGLAGSYNANVVRYILKLIDDYKSQGIETKLFMVGQRGYNTLKHQLGKYGFEIKKFYQDFPTDKVTGTAATVIAEDMAQAFVDGEIDSIEIVTTRFKNMMSYKVEEWKILPFEPNDDANADVQIDSLMTFDTDANSILQKIVPYYITNIIYQALLEATASELASRMTAMSAATQSADDMINLLTVDYNKARQAAVTNEITEVVSGADALKN